jgi:predicted  nucleic acid-binding Zn-ribbon protein
MQESLLNLLNLQGIDSQIDQLQHDKKDYPGRIASLEDELEQTGEVVQKKEQQSADLERQRRHFERELAAANEDLRKHKERFLEVKTNREYDALQLEIEACQKKISDYETQLLTVITHYEELQSQLQNDREKLSHLTTEKTAQIDELRKLLETVDDEVRACEVKRGALLPKINDRLLSIYNRIRKAKRGSAVVAVVRGACGGCYRHLPPQRLSEIKRNNRIISCESCGRVLVWVDELEST